MDQKCWIVLLVLTCLDFQTPFFQFKLFHFSFKATIDNFSLEADFWFPNIIELILNIAIGLLIGRKWQECSQYRHIPILRLILLENYSFEFFFIKVWIGGIILLDDFFIKQFPLLLLLMESRNPSQKCEKSNCLSKFVDFQTLNSLKLQAMSPSRFFSL